MSDASKWLMIAPDEAFLKRRLRNVQDDAMELGRRVVEGDRPARALLLFRIVRGQVGTDLLPSGPEVVGLEQDVAPEIDGLVIVRRGDDGGAPVEAEIMIRRRRADDDIAGIGRDSLGLPCPGVEPLDVAPLGIRPGP